MKISMELDLRPFTVPNYVSVVQLPGKKEDGFKEGIKLNLNEIDPIALDRLCNEFRKQVFDKAGHRDFSLTPS